MSFLDKNEKNKSHWWYERCIEHAEFRDFYLQRYNIFKEYLDKDFIIQAKKDPFSSFYELYICSKLCDSGFTLDKNIENKQVTNPDFKSGNLIFECVCPFIFNNTVDKKIEYIKMEDGTWLEEWSKIEDGSPSKKIFRSLVDKRKQHEKLIEDKKISYLICISLAKLVRGEKSNDSDGLVLTNPFNTDYSRPYAWMVNDHDCLMGEILYGYKSKIRIHDGSNEAKYVRMKHSDEKVNRKSRKYNFFENSSHVSGVLVSYEDGIVMEENSYKSILFQNPNASLPLSDDQLDKLKKFSRVWEQ